MQHTATWRLCKFCITHSNFNDCMISCTSGAFHILETSGIKLIVLLKSVPRKLRISPWYFHGLKQYLIKIGTSFRKKSLINFVRHRKLQMAICDVDTCFPITGYWCRYGVFTAIKCKFHCVFYEMNRWKYCCKTQYYLFLQLNFLWRPYLRRCLFGRVLKGSGRESGQWMKMNQIKYTLVTISNCIFWAISTILPIPSIFRTRK